MSTDNFVKGECRHCAGHLEFPAHAAGETIDCPHCGQPTPLVSPNAANRNNRRWLAGFLVGVVLVGGLAICVFLTKKSTKASLSPGPIVSVPIAKIAEPMDFLQTNGFGVSMFKLEKASGSSLVYAVGTLRNLTDKQRFGVKVEFSLLDANGQPLGKATDYSRQMEAHASWAFKALVLDSKAASAKLDRVTETQ
jgi:uncharacterized membrane protein